MKFETVLGVFIKASLSGKLPKIKQINGLHASLQE